MRWAGTIALVLFLFTGIFGLGLVAIIGGGLWLLIDREGFFRFLKDTLANAGKRERSPYFNGYGEPSTGLRSARQEARDGAKSHPQQ